jgi:hypothetical protein
MAGVFFSILSSLLSRAAGMAQRLRFVLRQRPASPLFDFHHVTGVAMKFGSRTCAMSAVALLAMTLVAPAWGDPPASQTPATQCASLDDVMIPLLPPVTQPKPVMDALKASPMWSGGTVSSQDVVTELAVYLRSQAHAMAVDMIEHKVLDQICGEQSYRRYFSKTCEVRDAYRKSSVGGVNAASGNFGWLSEPLHDDLVVMPACLYDSKAPDQEVARREEAELYALTAMVMMHKEQGLNPATLLAGLQQASWQGRPLYQAADGSLLCGLSSQRGCRLFTLSVLADYVIQKKGTVPPVSALGAISYKESEFCPRFIAQRKLSDAIKADLCKEADNQDAVLRATLDSYKTLLALLDQKGGSVSDEQKRVMQSRVITTVERLYVLAGKIRPDDAEDASSRNEKRLSLLRGVSAYANENYQAAGQEVLLAMRCDEGKESSKFCGSVALGFAIAGAKDRDAIKSLFEASFSPATAWRRRAETEWLVSLDAMVGARVALAHPLGGGDDRTLSGAFTPVGISLSNAAGSKYGAVGVMASVANLGNLAGYARDDADAAGVTSNEPSWRSVFAPGLFLRYHNRNSPVAWAIGCEWAQDQFKATLPSGVQQRRDSVNCGLGVGLDMLLFQMRP